MASTIVWTCDGGNSGHVAEPLSTTRQHPTCDTGKGNFISLEIAPPPFNVQNLNTTDLGNAFGAGFIIVSTAIVASFGVRIVVRFVRDLF